MSQRNVEWVVGRLVTDEAFRRRFTEDREGVLRELTEGGVELNGCELRALASIDSSLATQFADAIDPRIQKADIPGGKP